MEAYDEENNNHSKTENEEPNSGSEDADEINDESGEAMPEYSEEDNYDDETNISVTGATHLNESESRIDGAQNVITKY